MTGFKQWIFALCALLMATPAQAAVREVKILSTIIDDNLAVAQSKAEDYARKRAFYLTLSDYEEEDPLKIAQSMTDNQINMTVRGLTLLQDMYDTDTSQYSAEYMVSISEEAVKKLVSPDAADAAPEDATRMLVLPVLQNADGILLWEGSNVWRSIFNGVALSRGQNLLIMPYGDPTDKGITDGLKIPAQDFASLSPMLERYGAGEIVIATARYDKTTEPQRLLVSVRRLSDKVDRSKQIALNTDKRSQTPESLLPLAAENVTAQLIEIAKNFDGEQDRRLANAHRIPVTARLRRVRDWALIKKTLEELPGAVTLDVSQLSIDQATGTFHFNGTAEGLAKILKTRGLGATPSENGGLVIEAP
jgi:hypothetical protein